MNKMSHKRLNVEGFRASNYINDSLKAAIEEVLSAFPEKVKAYKNGKKALLGMFMGELMKKTGGKVDPKEANKLLREFLEAAVV